MKEARSKIIIIVNNREKDKVLGEILDLKQKYKFKIRELKERG